MSDLEQGSIMRETLFQYRCRLVRSFWRLGIGYFNPWSHFFLHPIVFELWDSFCQNTEEYPDASNSNEMETMMHFADDATIHNDSSSLDTEIDLEQEALLLAAQTRSEKRARQLKKQVCYPLIDWLYIL